MSPSVASTSFQRPRLGLAPKLLAITVLVAFLVAMVMVVRASSQLDGVLVKASESKGEAIALSLAVASEQGAGTSLSLVQSSIDSNKVITGVKYIYIEDPDGSIQAHTFSPGFPESLRGKNSLKMGELSSEQRVKIAPQLEFTVPSDSGGTRRVRVIDIAAPVSSGALGTIHVGMDREAIDAEVSSLQLGLAGWGGGVAVFGTALGLVLILMMVVMPLRELTRVTAAIVRSGDLTQKIRVSSQDEIGQLAGTFSRMVEKLKEIPLNLTGSAELLSEAVRNLSKSTSEQGETLSRQAAALQETQVTAQEIKQTSLVAAQKAESVLEGAERANQVSVAGEAAIEESLTGMSEIRARVDEIAQKITQLNDRTRQIGSITQTVKDLADQSNMLALNAAIEAVRSGEHGKGFGVVAREIRSLADQSIKATERVRDILEDIRGAIQEAVAITEKGSQRVEAGLVQIKASGESLRELSSIVKANSSGVRQISAAVSQQNAGISQIFTAVTSLSNMMDETMTRLRSTDDAATALKGASEKVSTVASSYRA